MSRMLIIMTYGADSPERATLPMVMATNAQSRGNQVNICMQNEAVKLLVKGNAEKVNVKGLPPLKELLEVFLKQGGKFMVCNPCLKSRGIKPTELIPDATVVAAGTLVSSINSSDKVIVY